MRKDDGHRGKLTVPNRFGEVVTYDIVLHKEYYRRNMSSDELLQTFGSNELLVAQPEGSEPARIFTDLEFASIYAMRVSVTEGIATIAVKVDAAGHCILKAYRKGKVMSFKAMTEYLQPCE